MSTRFLGTALVLGLLAGCQDTGVSTIVQSTGPNAPLGYEIEEQSTNLAKLIKVRQAAAQRVNELWQAQVDVRGTGRQAITLEYRFQWRDAQGIELASLLNAWRDVTVAPGETVALQGIASSPAAARYVFSVRIRQ